MAKIYVASSWRNTFQQNVVKTLRDLGHEVYDFKNPPHGEGGFQWSDIDPNWQNWTTEQYREALNHPIAQKGFDSDFNGMQWADVCVLVLPCGRSANTEAGWMKGAGKRVMVYSPKKEEPELMYKIYDFVSDSIFRINDEINKPCPQFPYWGATYPDACCVNGKLYDLDKCDENGKLYEPIDDVPCPFCRTEEFIELDPFGWIDHFCEEMEENGDTITDSMEQLAKQKARKAYFDWIDGMKKMYG